MRLGVLKPSKKEITHSNTEIEQENAQKVADQNFSINRFQNIQPINEE